MLNYLKCVIVVFNEVYIDIDDRQNGRLINFIISPKIKYKYLIIALNPKTTITIKLKLLRSKIPPS